MTSQGSAYGRFRKALERGNTVAALSAAAELPQLGLTEALELCLLLGDQEPEKYNRAAVRWHARYCREVRGVTLEEAQAVLATLAALPSLRDRAASALADLLYRRGLDQACAALIKWAS